MNVAAGLLIRILHVAFIAWFVWAPFSGVRSMLTLHAVVAPFLMLHWVTNSDKCALTVLEAKLRGVNEDTSFMHHLVAPVYVISDDVLKKTAWVVAVALWLVTLQQLVRRPNKTDVIPSTKP